MKKLDFSIYEVLNRDNSVVIKFRCSLCSCCVWREKEYDLISGNIPSDYIKSDDELVANLREELECMVEKSELNFSI